MDTDRVTFKGPLSRAYVTLQYKHNYFVGLIAQYQAIPLYQYVMEARLP